MSRVRYAMAIDTHTCVGCTACVMACKTENNVADDFSRVWVTQDLKGIFPDLSLTIQSERCNHCEDAPCVSVCPTGATHVGPGGIVLVDEDKCTGCKACIAACPYGARFIDPRSGTADKCTFCAHRMDDGVYTTACQDVCPTRSIHFGDMNDPDSDIARVLATRESYTLLPEAGTSPRIFYLK